MPERAVAFDNSVLSALVKSAVDPKLLNPVDQDRAKRARNFIRELNDQNAATKVIEQRTTVHIPLPAITECLAGWPTAKHVDVLKELAAVGTPCLFDDKAAIIAARIHRERKSALEKEAKEAEEKAAAEKKAAEEAKAKAAKEAKGKVAEGATEAKAEEAPKAVEKTAPKPVGARDCIKFDVQIAACCLAADIAVLYHADGDFTAISKLDACKGLRFQPLPSATKELAFKDVEKPNEQAKEKDKEG
ncbi:MAG: hypothetical protein BroJett014_05920 [Planctomycetota bacterium]|nr:hypothetical protein [Planctomycetota bacterium]GIK51619.1 MAG: hypothetical protein BroJett014_05920 [Planctomycetota bacterium]